MSREKPTAINVREYLTREFSRLIDYAEERGYTKHAEWANRMYEQDLSRMPIDMLEELVDNFTAKLGQQEFGRVRVWN